MELSVAEPTDTVKAYLSAIGRKGGLKGGKARAKKLSDARRSAIGRMGGLAKSKRRKEIIVAKPNSSQEN